MSVEGTWRNDYGSIMALTQDSRGVMWGRYRSSTGSIGEYHVTGYADTRGASASLGAGLALSILWRPVKGGQPDASWHWLSGLSGQVLIAADGSRSLNLVHALVATDPFGGIAAGTYVDKLVYSATSGAAWSGGAEDLAEPERRSAAAADPISGTWQCQQDPSMTLALQVVSALYGEVLGTLSLSGKPHQVAGFADTYAQAGGLGVQGLAVNAFINESGLMLSLAGSLNYATGVLTLLNLASRGTAAGAAYAQTAAATLTFVQAPRRG